MAVTMKFLRKTPSKFIATIVFASLVLTISSVLVPMSLCTKMQPGRRPGEISATATSLSRESSA